MDNNNTFGGFSAIGSMLSDPSKLDTIPSEPIDPNEDGDVIEKIGPEDGAEPIIDDPIDPSTVADPSDTSITDPEPELDPDDSNTAGDSTPDPEPDPEPTGDSTDGDEFDLSEVEPELASYAQEQLFNKWGLQVDEENKFKNIGDLVNFVEKTIEENSEPRYADGKIKELNDYVSNGGDLDGYFKSVYGSTGGDIDIATKAGQDKALREFFRIQGISDDMASSKIRRYEDTGVLRDEASDAFDYLEKYKEQTSHKLLEEQRRLQEESRKQQQEFYDNVETSIKNLKTVRGVPVTAQERNELLDYMFKPTDNGQTQYALDYNSSVNNLIESAFFTKKGDALVKKINSQASSNAAKALKDKLQTRTSVRGGSRALDDDGRSQVAFSSIGKVLGNSAL